MAEPTFCTVTEVGYKAGARANATSKGEAYVLAYAKGVESFINVACKYNFSDNYAGLNVDVKYILNEIQTNLTAIYVIAYDMSGTTMTSLQRIDAEDQIKVLYKRAMDCLKILQEQDKITYMKGA